MKIFMDDGGGVTDDSIRYFKAIAPFLSRIIKVEVSFVALRSIAVSTHYSWCIGREYTMIITDNEGTEVWLSGVNCGFSGTGPHGSYELLKEMRFIQNISFEETGLGEARQIVYTRDAQGSPYKLAVR